MPPSPLSSRLPLLQPLWGFSLFFPSEASPYAHPAEAAGAETRIFSQRQFNSKNIYHETYQGFRPRNGGESGLRFRHHGPGARRRGRPDRGRRRSGCERACDPQREREETPRKSRRQRHNPGRRSHARSVREARAGRGYDSRKDSSRKRHRIERRLVGRRRLRAERTAGPPLCGGTAGGVRHDGRSADRRHAPCRQRRAGLAGRRGADPRIRAAGHHPPAGARRLFLRRGASRHCGRHQRGA